MFDLSQIAALAIFVAMFIAIIIGTALGYTFNDIPTITGMTYQP